MLGMHHVLEQPIVPLKQPSIFPSWHLSKMCIGSQALSRYMWVFLVPTPATGAMGPGVGGPGEGRHWEA